jgi:hypothetical protein
MQNVKLAQVEIQLSSFLYRWIWDSYVVSGETCQLQKKFEFGASTS